MEKTGKKEEKGSLNEPKSGCFSSWEGKGCVRHAKVIYSNTSLTPLKRGINVRG